MTRLLNKKCARSLHNLNSLIVAISVVIESKSFVKILTPPAPSLIPNLSTSWPTRKRKQSFYTLEAVLSTSCRSILARLRISWASVWNCCLRNGKHGMLLGMYIGRRTTWLPPRTALNLRLSRTLKIEKYFVICQWSTARSKPMTLRSEKQTLRRASVWRTGLAQLIWETASHGVSIPTYLSNSITLCRCTWQCSLYKLFRQQRGYRAAQLGA